MTSKEEGGLSKTDQAKQLLTQYGSAYLITSISFAAVSFAACYAAVNAGEHACMRSRSRHVLTPFVVRAGGQRVRTGGTHRREVEPPLAPRPFPPPAMALLRPQAWTWPACSTAWGCR